ncbi:MAG: DUF4249 domain-containing protein [Prevotellaceae bacterium]|jgi:hypothetical protein|nr:DUF4249 domain-containing protein [Prevotellaceae bacterium]
MMMREAIKTKILYGALAACCAALLPACEGMVQYIDIPASDQPAKLAVSATIDTDGSFFLSFSEGRSLSAYSTGKREYETIIRQGKVTLRDETEGRDIYVNSSEFDMSLRSSEESGYRTMAPGLPIKAGHTYRLTLAIGGYPEATATARMPDAPIVEQALPDLQQPKHYNNAYIAEPFNPNIFEVRSIDCFPVALRLTDNSPDRDYYMVYLHVARRYPGGGLYPDYLGDSSSEPYTLGALPYVAISDMAVVQDNPDVETGAMAMDAEVGALIFDKMLLSDMSFANTTGTINLLVDKEHFVPCSKASEGSDTTFLCVAHLTPLSYTYYRSLSLQSEGIGFFAEPVSVPSNIENGYGCFSAISIARASIATYKPCD